jgi:hypothetical protein
MSNYSKDDREKTPKEQAGNFIASMGGMLRTGKGESAVAAKLADLLIEVASLKNPAGFAKACSRAMTEWADVNRASPGHAYDLAVLASKRSKDQIVTREEVTRALEGPAPTPVATRFPQHGRRAAGPKARGV